jgi:hypothetical protein
LKRLIYAWAHKHTGHPDWLRAPCWHWCLARVRLPAQPSRTRRRATPPASEMAEVTCGRACARWQRSECGPCEVGGQMVCQSRGARQRWPGLCWRRAIELRRGGRPKAGIVSSITNSHGAVALWQDPFSFAACGWVCFCDVVGHHSPFDGCTDGRASSVKRPAWAPQRHNDGERASATTKSVHRDAIWCPADGCGAPPSSSRPMKMEHEQIPHGRHD